MTRSINVIKSALIYIVNVVKNTWLIPFTLLINLYFSGPANASDVDASLQLKHIKSLVADNQLNLAKEQLESLLNTDPNNAAVHFNYGVVNGHLAKQASIFKAGRFAQASKNAFIEAINVDPNYVPGYQGLIQFYLGAPAIAGGSTKKAIKTANKLMEVSPLNGTLSHYQIARNQDDEEKQAELVAQLNEQFPESSQAQFTVGFYYQSLKEYELAYQAFKKAAHGVLAINKQDNNAITDSEIMAIHSALYQLGRNAVFSEQHVDDGIKAMTKYLKQDNLGELPSKNWGQYRLAQLFILNKNLTQAESTLLDLKSKLSQDNGDKELQKLVNNALKSIKT